MASQVLINDSHGGAREPPQTLGTSPLKTFWTNHKAFIGEIIVYISAIIVSWIVVDLTQNKSLQSSVTSDSTNSFTGTFMNYPTNYPSLSNNRSSNINCTEPLPLKCPTESPCNCPTVSFQETCTLPIQRQCRACPVNFEQCTAEKCICPVRKKQQTGKNLTSTVTEKTINQARTIDLLNQYPPLSSGRLETALTMLTFIDKYLNLMSVRPTNAGPLHTGQGGRVSRPCHICKGRYDWVRRVYQYELTGYVGSNLQKNEAMLSSMSDKFRKNFALYSYFTGFEGHFGDEDINPLTMPKQNYDRTFLSVDNYQEARFIPKALSFTYIDEHGKKGNIEFCSELESDKKIKEHIQCIWLGSVAIMDLLTLNY